MRKISYPPPPKKNDVDITNALQSLGITGYAGQAISDADLARENSLYKTFDAESQYYIANLPHNINGYLLTLKNATSDGTMIFWNQLLLDESFKTVAFRRKVTGYGSETWEAWQSVGRTIYVRKDGTGDFTKFTDALDYGMHNRNTTIYVEDGIYDIIQELGNSYFESFEYVPYTNMGPKIGNGTHIICSSNSKIICHYTGSNQQVITGFSPINSVIDSDHASAGDFVIENMTIEASNVRYAIHDDFGGQTIPAHHQYLGCQFKTEGRYSIGSGLGPSSEIVVDGCIFSGSGEYGVFFHSGDGEINRNARNRLIIRNCYFDDGLRITIASNGLSEQITPVLISGNRLGAPIEKTINPGSYDNMKIYAWNNTQ